MEYPGPRLDTVDLDEDGHLDVACVAQPTGAQVFFGDGAGVSDETVSLDGPTFEVQIGDLDDDGLADVLTNDALFVNLGDRSFERIELPSNTGEIVAIGRFAAGGSQLLTLTLADESTGGALHTLSPDLEWRTELLTVPLHDDTETPLSETWVVADLDGDGTDEVVAGSDIWKRDGCG